MSLDASPTPNSPRIPAWTLGDRLRKARVVAEVRVDEMAEHLDVSPDTVTNYEKDKTRPRRSVLMAYANRCNVPLGWIEAGDGFDMAAQEVDATQGRASGGRAPRSSTPDVLSGCRTNKVIDMWPDPLGDSTEPCRLAARGRRYPASPTPRAKDTDPVARLAGAR